MASVYCLGTQPCSSRQWSNNSAIPVSVEIHCRVLLLGKSKNPSPDVVEKFYHARLKKSCPQNNPSVLHHFL
jgi:hypothetical protein